MDTSPGGPPVTARERYNARTARGAAKLRVERDLVEQGAVVERVFHPHWGRPLAVALLITLLIGIMFGAAIARPFVQHAPAPLTGAQRDAVATWETREAQIGATQRAGGTR